MTIAIYDIQAILVNGVMKAVGSGKICKTKVEEIWQHYKKYFDLCIFRRPSYPGIINKAFTLEHVSEEGDIVYTPEQTSLTDQQGTLDASWAIQPNSTPAHNEEIEMVEYLV